ncbi:hypothetical protein DFS33DRAFT_1320824 [Desarmillaria ectypa]|nr:hypothetical protein DFS33DRAFT_1320824 [Desarmillaria ectypa]
MSTESTGKPIALPAFDNTLGALYIGSSISTVLYGVICVQTFLYITSNRTRFDSWPMKLFGLDTAHQCLMLAGMYRFLITDYANPAALPTGGPSSGEAILQDEGIVGCISAYESHLSLSRSHWHSLALLYLSLATGTAS